MNDVNREIELEIVSNSWLSLTDAEGFDRLIESWSRIIEEAGHGSPSASGGELVDGIVQRQLGPIGDIIESETEVRQVDPLEREIERVSGATMILSPEGNVVAMSDDAAHAFGVQLGAAAGKDWLDPQSTDDFAALRRSLKSNGNIAFAVLRVRQRDGRTVFAEAYGLATELYPELFAVVRSLDFEWSDTVSTKLIQSFSLTEAEVDICRLLLQEGNIATVAEQRGARIGTVRVQLKRVFEKTGIHSKADLIRLLAAICSRDMEATDRKDLRWSDPLGRETYFVRSDGRRLAYCWIGAENGREAIFVHGELPIWYLPPRIEEALAQADVKLICVSMPGHGSSDPPAKGVAQVDDGITGLEELLAEFGRPLPMVASHSGKVYPMLLGCRPDPLISAITLVGIPWDLTPDTYQELPQIHKVLSQLAMHSPRMFRLVCSLGYRLLLRHGPDFYLTRAISSSDSDRKLVRNVDILPYLRIACRHLVAQGPDAFINETIRNPHYAPHLLLPDLTVPCKWLAPAEQQVSSPENLATAQGMSQHISVELVPESGSLLTYHRPDIFVRAMADLVSDDPATRFAETGAAYSIEKQARSPERT